MRENIELEEAQELLLARVKANSERGVKLSKSLGRILSQDIRACSNIPSFNKSPLDGYAVRARDTSGADSLYPIKLRVIEEVRAGSLAECDVVPGTAIKVMTGAPIPEGADTVIKYEEVRAAGDIIEVFKPYRTGNNVIQAGEEISRGEIIACKGMRITPPLIGLLAGTGMISVPVFSEVKAAILSTGDELIDISEELKPGKIYDSSLYTLEACCRELGIKTMMMGITSDKEDDVSKRVSRSLKDADIVIISGGISAGDYDVVKDALSYTGAEIIFRKVAMKPGAPMVAAVKDDKIIIGLSGNPAAAMVTFNLIVVPVIKKMMGFDRYLPSRIKVILADKLDKPSKQRRFLRGMLCRLDGIDYLKLAENQGHLVLKSMMDCNILGDVPAGSQTLNAGQEITAHIIGNTDDIYHKQDINWIPVLKSAVSR